MQLRLVVQADEAARDIVVDADPATTARQFVDAVAEHLGQPRDDGRTIWAQSERTGKWLGGADPVSDAGLRQGDKLVLQTHSELPTETPGPYELVVIAGPETGRRIPLRVGDHQLGRDPARCDVVLDDPEISRLHLSIRVSPDRLSLSDAGSTNGTRLGAERLRPSVWRILDPSDVVSVGDSRLRFQPTALANVGRQPDASGFIEFNRPPRVTSRFTPPAIALERPPDEPRGARFPIAAILLPTALAGAAAVAFVQPQMLAFAALSPAMAAWSYFEDRGSGRKQFDDAANAFRSQLGEARTRLESARAREADVRLQAAPTPADLLERSRVHAATLWERRPNDPDFLRLRIGTADQLSAVEVRVEDGGSAALRDEAERQLRDGQLLQAAPVTLELGRLGSIGVTGSRDDVTAATRWLVAQTVSLHSPRDLVIAAVISTDELEQWSWLKWIPHTFGDSSPLRTSALAVGDAAAGGLIDGAVAELRSRQQERERSSTAPGPSPSILLVIDGRVVRNRAQVSKILGAAPDLGIFSIWLGSTVHDLPGECRGIIEVTGSTAVWTPGSQEERIPDIRLDTLSPAAALEVARAMAPLRDVSADTAKSSVPTRLGLFELLGTRDLTESYVVDHWAASAEDVSAPIGRTATAQFDLDLRRDGPHGLIAGTTGAGKSELLQTIIASLAVRHRPDRLTFLLVDYKGGAAFRECVALPHTLGIVTDLDEHLTERALISLNAELKRRERILDAAGAKDLTTMAKRDLASAPARLLIMIDEFATLAREVPAFVDGVVDIAQRGRSLGVHLVLATQRPAGVVTPSIKANTNLRIALRVSDVADSEDVIAAPDAARISRGAPGRAYARIGHDQMVEFQAAYVGGHLSGETLAPIQIRDFGFGATAEGPRRSVTLVGDQPTELSRLVEVVGRAAAQVDVQRQPAPWLPPLPEVVSLDSLTPAEDDGEAQALIGLLDEPSDQRQRPATFDLATDGSLLIYGTSGSGKTTLMRTIATSLAKRAGVKSLNIYGLDLATGGLKVLEVLPHCGSVIVGNDEERVVRLFGRLRSSLELRRRALSEAGVSSIGELAEDRRDHFPRILVLLNGYGAFVSAFERGPVAAVVDALPRLVADGRGVGIHFVISADRRGVVPGSLAGVVPKRVILRMSDEDEYASFDLARKQFAKVRFSPGRGFYENHEIQCAVVGDDPSGGGQTSAIASLAANLERGEGDARPSRVELLPEEVDRASLPAPAHRLEAVLGIRDSDLLPVTISVRDGNFVVIGPYRSGRTTALETIVTSLKRATPDLEMHLLAPRPSRLTTLDLWTDVAKGASGCAEWVRSSAAAAAETVAETEPTRLIVIDDGQELMDDDIADALALIVRRGRDGGTRLLAGLERQAARGAFGGWFAEMKKDGSALILQPDLDVDGDLFGLRLPRTSAQFNMPGRGFLVQRGRAELMQVAGSI
jgi:S-DNA-T family DNA segregation ATPase FtsK/SpoIIIE